MNEFRSDYDRRIGQFRHYLNLMVSRHRTAAGDRFLIISDRSDADEGDARKRRVKRQRHLYVRALTGTKSDTTDLPAEEFFDSSEDDATRFVQFRFWERFVVCDLPLSTCSRFEGRRIIRDRPGFGYVRERPDYPYYRNDVPTWDPLQKQYILDDMETAAVDTAHIFFHIWRFPVDSRLYINSHAFHTGHSWEIDHLID